MNNMELSQLRYFLEVGETQHMTRSAERLHISQPSLTKAINRLEDELGVPLFVAKGRNIILTSYGTFLYKRLKPLVSDIDRIPGDLRTMASLESATIHLNVLAASAIVTEAIKEYKKVNDNVNFQFMQQMDEQFYDICVTTRHSYQMHERKQHHETVFTEEIYLAVPRSHPLAEKDEIALIEAREEGFITLMGTRQLRGIYDWFFEHAGFTPRIIFESDNPDTVRNMIEANFGVGFWPQRTWGSINSPDVKLLRITTPVCRRSVIIDYMENKSDSTPVKRFFDFLVGYFNRSTEDLLKR